MYTRSFSKMELTFFSLQKLTIVCVMNMHTATKILSNLEIIITWKIKMQQIEQTFLQYNVSLYSIYFVINSEHVSKEYFSMII